MERILFSLIAAATCIIASAQQAQPSLADYFSKLTEREDVYCFGGKRADIHGRFNNPGPVFIIFPDSRTTHEEAEKMIEECGIKQIVDDYTGSIFFFNPLAKEYDNKADFESYHGFIDRLRIAFNIKVIGIGRGATFVNETIARKAGNVAGIVSIGGKAPKKALEGESPVPAYITGKNARKTAASYIVRNDVELASSEGSKSLYVNRNEPLIRVVVNQSDEIDLAEAIADAWDSVLSWNYRFNNYKHTWYTGESYCEHGDSEFEPFIMFDRLGITRNVCTENLNGTGDFLWYEYIPQAATNAEKGTVPLVVLLHGNNNDPRTQAETSGFLPIASREGFIVAEFEWQGNGWTPMGHDGIETTIYELFRKYPQIDRSRVYCEGLSAGAFNATALGIKKTHIFAAVGSQSGGIMVENRFGSCKETLFDEAILKSEGCDMPYFSISGSDDEIVVFPKPGETGPNRVLLSWQAYQILNNLPYIETLDFSIDKDFGMKLENRRREDTNKGISYEIGDMTKNNIPLIRYVVVDGYGHWNFQPGAELMWNYFKMFSRDYQTKKLIYHE